MLESPCVIFPKCLLFLNKFLKFFGQVVLQIFDQNLTTKIYEIRHTILYIFRKRKNSVEMNDDHEITLQISKEIEEQGRSIVDVDQERRGRV